MKFAHFSHIWAKPGMTPHQRYEELWRELQLCDELGFDYGFCVEHHFRPDESWMSSPSLYAVGAGARTRRLRLGPMGYIVPLYHPLRLAEEIAIVDQMLGGRMELGLVPGINADYFRPFGLDYDLRKSPTLEFVDYMRAAFGETQPFSFHGNCKFRCNDPNARSFCHQPQDWDQFALLIVALPAPTTLACIEIRRWDPPPIRRRSTAIENY
jgi:alkanesulfonate monooxygenase SsuD/methylene tetrahydromethanopterin reductase-like flavin-dependent oxidoreductase (luciferase family)